MRILCLASGLIATTEVKVSAHCVDLSEIDAKSLNNMAKSDQRFDVIYSLLTLHHVPNPSNLLNRVLKEGFMNPGLDNLFVCFL